MCHYGYYCDFRMYTREGPFLRDTPPILLVMTLRATALPVREARSQHHFESTPFLVSSGRVIFIHIMQ